MDTEAKRAYEIAPVVEGDVEEVMSLLKRTFYVEEPMNAAVGLCSEGTDTSPELDEYCSSAILSGLSFKVVSDEGQIVSVIINGEYRPSQNDETKLLEEAKTCQNKKFQKILYVLARREEYAKLWQKFPDKTIVEVKVAATDQSWQRKGLMKALVEHTEGALRARGLKVLRMDTSSCYSALCAERLGFRCEYSAAYKDILLDGQPLLVPEPPHNDDRVYIKILDYDNNETKN